MGGSYWLDRLDAVYENAVKDARYPLLQTKPSEYFQRQCWVSGRHP